MDVPDPAEASDEDLVRAFQGGDEDAFTSLVERHRRGVYRVTRAILREHAAADEAAQEALVKAWSGLRSFQGASSFRTWITRIAMNAAYDLGSRDATQARVRRDALREAGPSWEVAREPAPLDVLAREEELARVRAAVSRLPERQRRTLELRVVADLSNVQVAEILGSPVGTVKANVHHAVQNLRRLLAEGATRAAAPGRFAREGGSP